MSEPKTISISVDDLSLGGTIGPFSYICIGDKDGPVADLCVHDPDIPGTAKITFTAHSDGTVTIEDSDK